MFEIDYGLKDLENYSGDESSYISSNGLRFAYGTFGNKSNPAIILVAGLYNQMVRCSTTKIGKFKGNAHNTHS